MTDPWVLAVYIPPFILAVLLPAIMWPVCRALTRRDLPAALAAKSAYLLAGGVVLSVLMFGVTRLHAVFPWLPEYAAISASPPALVALYIVCWTGAMACSIGASIGMLHDWTLSKARVIAISIWIACTAVYALTALLI